KRGIVTTVAPTVSGTSSSAVTSCASASIDRRTVRGPDRNPVADSNAGGVESSGGPLDASTEVGVTRRDTAHAVDQRRAIGVVGDRVPDCRADSVT
ncbi:MAG TPA: hypothetical protein VFV63_02965, partial [Ilumatobacteraceae bacterium]|nr:hypothetical protein [Ilumatobacteraceae bacterium]